MRKLTLAVIVASGALASVVAGQVLAQDPAALVDARQAEMKKLGGALKALTGYAKDSKASQADIDAAVATINAVAQNAGSLFTPGTAVGVGDSEALATIWTDTAKFQAVAGEFGKAVGGLNAAASDRAALGKAVQALGGACKGCHDTFRKG